MHDDSSSAIQTAVAHNEAYVASHGMRALPTAPSQKLAIVTCMDSRLDLFGALGLDLGEAHIIRNAGGIATPDVVRSLILSQWLLGTDTIMVIHHSRCGVHGLDEENLRSMIAAEVGSAPDIEFGSFDDPAEDVRRTASLLRDEPALKTREIRGFIFDVDTGAIDEVELP